MTLEEAIADLNQKIAHSSKLNTEISEKGINWHIDHSLNVILSVFDSLKKSNPEDYKPSFSLVKFGILLTEIIPRGKGKAPKKTISEGEISSELLLKKVNEAKSKIANIKKLPKNSNFKHPLFGLMNLKTSIKFIRVHTNHHLKIMNDIIKN